jgi:hypothetical protein
VSTVSVTAEGSECRMDSGFAGPRDSRATLSLRPVSVERAGRKDARGGQPANSCFQVGRLQRIGGAS